MYVMKIFICFFNILDKVKPISQNTVNNNNLVDNARIFFFMTLVFPYQRHNKYLVRITNNVKT